MHSLVCNTQRIFKIYDATIKIINILINTGLRSLHSVVKTLLLLTTVFDSEINIIGFNLSKKLRIFVRFLNIICPDDVISYKFYKNSQFGTYPDVDIPQQPQFQYS